MPRGGKRPGAGRKKGDGPTKTMARKKVLTALDNGTSPLDYMLKVMSGELPYDLHRFEAAKAAAPYMHPRLQAIEHSGEIVSKHEEAVDEMERAAGISAAATNGASDSELDELEGRVLN